MTISRLTNHNYFFDSTESIFIACIYKTQINQLFSKHSNCQLFIIYLFLISKKSMVQVTKAFTLYLIHRPQHCSQHNFRPRQLSLCYPNVEPTAPPLHSTLEVLLWPHQGSSAPFDWICYCGLRLFPFPALAITRKWLSRAGSKKAAELLVLPAHV